MKIQEDALPICIVEAWLWPPTPLASLTSNFYFRLIWESWCPQQLPRLTLCVLGLVLPSFSAVFPQRTVLVFLLSYEPPPKPFFSLLTWKDFCPAYILPCLVYFATISMPAETVSFACFLFLECKPSFCHVLLYLCPSCGLGAAGGLRVSGQGWWRNSYYLCFKHSGNLLSNRLRSCSQLMFLRTAVLLRGLSKLWVMTPHRIHVIEYGCCEKLGSRKVSEVAVTKN